MCATHAMKSAASLIVTALFAAVPANAQSSDADQAEAPQPLRTDSRAPYVHRITLYDHDGVAIAPDDVPAQPYSPMRTCGKCHEVGLIAKGWHFNANLPGVDPGRPGEPWFLTDEESGLTLPLSGRGWPGTLPPDAVDLSAWDVTRRFGGHMPGGGFGTPAQQEIDASDESARWEISGPREIDCLFCHNNAGFHDPAESARQLEAENLRWAATAAAGLAVIRGEARKVPDDFDPFAPPNPDFPEQALPEVEYDESRFDGDDRVVFDITRRPPAERCYFCHSFREVGPQAAPSWQVAGDIHLAAGMTCTDCHRNGIDHNITRGYPTGGDTPHALAADALTCKGCHLGTGEIAEGPSAGAGRRGAPYPEHRGLPPIHFDKLSCTACHSGPWPEEYTRRFQTAMNHGLGLPTREREEHDLPEIAAPVFARRDDGKIAPHRMVWPTLGAADAAAIKGVELQHASVDESRPHLWPLAHDVRPESQSLGIHGCTDCHAPDAPYYFGNLAAVDDQRTVERSVHTMMELRGDDPALVRTFASSFGWRTVFKWSGVVCLMVVALVWLRHGLAGVGARRNA